MDVLNLSKTAVVLALAATFSACGGGGGGGGAGILNRAPVSNAGGAQTVDEFATVNLDGSASSDPDSNPITFAWTQTAGTSVTITNSDTAQASFDAPDVTAVNTPEVLTFQLQVSDGTLNGTATVSITVNDAGLGANSPPTANAGGDQTVAELSTVNLDGSGSSDPDANDVLTYAWLQTAGSAVVLSDATVAQPSFMSPDVDIATPEVLTFQLTVDDGTDSAMATVDITVQEGLSMVMVAGTLSYEFPLPNGNCNGLNLDNPAIRPIRGVTVQLFDTVNNTVLGTTVSAGDGGYSFANIDANLDVLIRVRAELMSSSPAVWDVELRDNVDTSATPPPIGSDNYPLYVVDFPQFSTGVTNISDADFVAMTGWDGNAYSSPRLAALFAILDSILDGMEMITAVDPTVTFAPLNAFWSVNNTLTSPSDIPAGELSSSFYSGGIDSVFLLGDASVDTEEFDDHVVMHEWAHYFEDNFSRSDSTGGPHTIGESLDPRLAFGEGFATALAAIALENPQYCDTNAPIESGGFGLDTENDNFGEQGFYNEMSVATLINDLWDNAVDGTDNGSVGFAPIYAVMTGPQRTTEAFTTLLSFATELRANVQAADLAFVDSQLSRENIDLGALDIYGDGQTTIMATTPNGGTPRDVLPVYTDLPINGTVINICTNSDFDSGRGGNKLSEHRLLRFTTAAASTYDVSVTANPVPPATSDPTPTPPAMLCDGTEVCDRSDPDVFIYRAGQLVAISQSSDADSETFTTQSLPADSYVFDLQEWRYSDDIASSDYPEQVCFDVSMSP